MRRVSLYAPSPGLFGFGQDETPPVLPLPWEKPSEAELAAKSKTENWDRFAKAVGVLGGIVGLVLGVRALTGKN